MDGWKLIYRGYEPRCEPLREALCTLGNGYFATRGAAEESQAGGPHYPGTYLAGGYNRLESEIRERIIENEDLVNWPNWLSLSFRPENGAWFELEKVQIDDYRQELDMRSGVLERHVRFRDALGRETSLHTRRLVHMNDPHVAAIQWMLTPENWSGVIEIRSALDGTVRNEGVARYRPLSDQHLEPESTARVGEDGMVLVVRTCQSRIRMAQAARTRVFIGTEPAAVVRQTHCQPGFIGQSLVLECEEHRPVRVEKVVALYTSRDAAISEERLAACAAVRRAEDFAGLRASHERAWARLWRRIDMQLTDSAQAQVIVRLHLFHLLQSVSRHVIDLDVGVPARGLHGEAYRGHIFWDELYVFPLLNLTLPEISRALLMYRYRRIDEARRAARAAGFKGAMYPWQSGSDGREETQRMHLNPRSGRWLPDLTSRQRHVNAAIAYNVWQYYQATEDLDFLHSYGAEMIVEIARFFASIATFNTERQRYEIRNVVGPDEYHTAYPDRDEPGIDNNAYTNVMAVWVIRCAFRALALLSEHRHQELLADLGLTGEELERCDHVSRLMYVPFIRDGLLSQFEGYEKLQEFDWDRYRRTYGDIQRLDRILEAEGDTPNRYKVAKQADVLMLFCLLPVQVFEELFARIGYNLSRDDILDNVEYYSQRTSHGSSLSRVVHSWVLARSDRKRSWTLFEQALMSDVKDTQGGTTPEGVHLGAMAGTIDLIRRAYAGLEIRDDVLWLNPRLPSELGGLRLRVRYRGHWILIDINHQRLLIQLERRWKTHPAKIGFRGEVVQMDQGEQREFAL